MVRIPFNAFSTAPYSSCTLWITVRSTRLTTPTAIPRDEISTGYISAFQEFSNASEDATRTSAAHVASANEPKRSAPIPAMSPTLSPMHAGLRLSSSSKPYSFLPERSAPTSAAFRVNTTSHSAEKSDG